MQEELKSGIYKIINLKNKKIYIGSAKNLNKRWKRHLNDLKNKTHHNIHLQRAWDKHGEKSFIFEVIELVDPINLHQREQFYIDTLQPFNQNGYNIGKNSSGGDNLSINPNRVDIIRKMSVANKKKWDDTSDEYKKAYAMRYIGSDNPNWRNGSSQRFCVCGKKMDLKATVCSTCYDKSGEKNPFYGKTHTDEFKQQRSLQQTDVYNGSQNIPIIINSVEYRSAGEASKKLNIPMVTIRWRVMSKNIKFVNYQYK